MTTMKNTAITLLIICGLAVLVAATLDMVKGARAHQAQIDMADLSEACHKRWSKNGRYRPMPMEVRGWLEMAEQLDAVINSVEWYAALMDLESLGDPTTNVKEKVGRAYGLSSLKPGTAEDICKREAIKVTNIRYALLNPGFSIRMMVLHVEGLYYKYDGDLRRVLLAYNSGEPRADKLIAREERGEMKIEYTHHRNHRERLDMIKSAIFQQGGRR